MKRFISFFILSLLLVNTSDAQDTIIKTNGEHLFVNIIKIYADEIRYKRLGTADATDFAVYVINKKEVKVIKYSHNASDIDFMFAYSSSAKDTINKDAKIYKPEFLVTPGNPPVIVPLGAAQYIYQNKVIKEKEVYHLLSQSKDGEILYLRKLSKRTKANMYCSLAGFALSLVPLVDVTTGNKFSHIKDVGNNTLYAGCVLAGGSISIPILTIFYLNKHIKANTKAINLYNQSH